MSRGEKKNCRKIGSFQKLCFDIQNVSCYSGRRNIGAVDKINHLCPALLDAVDAL